VTAREHEPILGEKRVEFAAGHCRTDAHNRPIYIEGDLPHVGEVDEKGVIPYTPGCPAVPSGSHGDLQPTLARQLHSRYDVFFVCSLEDDSRVAIGLASVEDASNPLLLLAVVAAPVQVALECGHYRHLLTGAMTQPLRLVNNVSKVVRIVILISFLNAESFLKRVQE